MRVRPGLVLVAAPLLVAGVAVADPALRVHPTTARPGDAVLVTVTAATDVPRGAADGKPLQFFRAKHGFQAVFAVPLDAGPDPIAIEVDSVKRPATVTVKPVVFPEARLEVEEDLANPPPGLRQQVDADNAAILAAVRKGDGEPQFTRPFLRPRGKVTSTFGEWRTFNDGHRSRHLGLDVAARERAKVAAINAGTVTLVSDTFLAGKVVVIAHGGGIASAYFHLSAAAVDVGDTVRRGQTIGRAGQTGRTTGPHIHLGVRVPGGFVDPATFVKLPLAPVPAEAPAAPATARR